MSNIAQAVFGAAALFVAMFVTAPTVSANSAAVRTAARIAALKAANTEVAAATANSNAVNAVLRQSLIARIRSGK